jgi:hypothetical protein
VRDGEQPVDQRRHRPRLLALGLLGRDSHDEQGEQAHEQRKGDLLIDPGQHHETGESEEERRPAGQDGQQPVAELFDDRDHLRGVGPFISSPPHGFSIRQRNGRGLRFGMRDQRLRRRTM